MIIISWGNIFLNVAKFFKFCYMKISWRIFGLSSAAEPSSLDVGKYVSDDLPKVGSAQRTVLQVVTVSPGGHGQRGQSGITWSKQQLHNIELVFFLTCKSRRHPVWAGRCLNAPPGDCGSSYRCEAGRQCWTSPSHHHYTHTEQKSVLNTSVVLSNCI